MDRQTLYSIYIYIKALQIDKHYKQIGTIDNCYYRLIDTINGQTFKIDSTDIDTKIVYIKTLHIKQVDRHYIKTENINRQTFKIDSQGIQINTIKRWTIQIDRHYRQIDTIDGKTKED